MSLVLIVAISSAFAEKRADQVVKPDSSSSDTTQKPVWGYPTYVTSGPDSVFVEISEPTENVRKPQVLERVCPICDSCYPIDLKVRNCTLMGSRYPCANSCDCYFECRRTNEEFTVHMNECDRIKWGFWKKLKK